jgi:hypothetical protein
VVLIPVSFAIPYLPGAALLGFVPLPAALLPVLAAITVLYVGATELLKRRFYAPRPRRPARDRRRVRLTKGGASMWHGLLPRPDETQRA